MIEVVIMLVVAPHSHNVSFRHLVNFHQLLIQLLLFLHID